MRAIDLRIGNITSFGAVYCIEDKNFYVYDSEGTSYKSSWADLQPVQLTEEWLFNLGFVNHSEGEFYKDWKCKSLKIRYKKDNQKFVCGIWTDDDDDCAIVWLDYVHQLQNLYYLLTNTELTIKK